MKKYFLPLSVLGIFMTVAVTLWLTQDNIFYFLILAILEYQFLPGYFFMSKNTNMPAELHSF